MNVFKKFGKLAAVLTLALALVVTLVPILYAHADVGDVPAHSKTLTDNKDGTYNLELTVTGDADTDSELDAKANVLVMIDTSNSMQTNRADGTTGSPNSTHPARADQAEMVAYNFAHSLFGIQGADIQMALMTFNHGTDLLQTWTKTESQITSHLSSGGDVQF